jgi:chorismate dehydratase
MCRFLTLPYANALPLVHYIRQVCPQAELLCRTPRWSLEALLTGKFDAALVPVVDLFTHPELEMIPDLGICADGEVTSVLLQCSRPLAEVGTIELDPDSKTSNVLAQVLMQHHFRLSDRVKYTSDGGDGAARVCIADRALCTEPAWETYDLAGQWKEMTGLPFVFAVWAFGSSCTDRRRISRILYRAKEIGCRSRPALARLCAKRLGLPHERCLDYLTNRIHYDVGRREQEGMNLFRQLAVNLLGPRIGRPVGAIPDQRRLDVPILERD